MSRTPISDNIINGTLRPRYTELDTLGPVSPELKFITTSGTVTDSLDSRDAVYDSIYRNTNLSNRLTQAASSAVSGLISTNLGISTSTAGLGTAINNPGTYETLNYSQLFRTPGLRFQDFRNFKKSGTGRLDGSNTLLLGTRKSGVAATMVALNAASIASAQIPNSQFRTAGTYNFFGRESYFGMGTPDDPGALRLDYTQGTEATKIWKSNEWRTPVLLNAVPFRGDRVNARDVEKTDYANIYNWRSSKGVTSDIDENASKFKQAVAAIKTFVGNKRNLTKDFIKFYFTGKDVYPGSELEDDVFVFRASISNLNDSFTPTWQPITALGRADKNYIYTDFTRQVTLDFKVHATSRDELRPMWRKLNYLATYTMPEYDVEHPTYRGKYLRMTVGDLFISQPVFINSLTYTLAGTDSTWEINLEEDENIKQVPHGIDVSMQFTFIGNQIPQYKGHAYSLHDEEQIKTDGSSNTPGNGNWLSDAKNTFIEEQLELSALGVGQLETPSTDIGLQQSNNPSIDEIINNNL